RVKPAPRPDATIIPKLIADLDNQKFAVRERAGEQLHELAELAVAALREAADKSDSAEVRNRAAKLVEEISKHVVTSNQLRALRAVEMLERLKTPEAVALLEKLAGGAAETIPTPQARAALERLKT